MHLFTTLPVIAVQTNPDQHPTAIRPPRSGWLAVDAVTNDWLVETGWWTGAPVNRHYFVLLVADSSALYEVYRDRDRGSWHLSRHYD